MLEQFQVYTRYCHAVGPHSPYNQLFQHKLVYSRFRRHCHDSVTKYADESGCLFGILHLQRLDRHIYRHETENSHQRAILEDLRFSASLTTTVLVLWTTVCNAVQMTGGQSIGTRKMQERGPAVGSGQHIVTPSRPFRHMWKASSAST